MNKCSLTHNISGVGGVTKKRTKTSCCMNLNYNNAYEGANNILSLSQLCFLFSEVAILKPIQNSKLPFLILPGSKVILSRFFEFEF